MAKWRTQTAQGWIRAPNLWYGLSRIRVIMHAMHVDQQTSKKGGNMSELEKV